MPSRNSRLYKCGIADTKGDLKCPNGACQNCIHYLGVGPVGRPNLTGVDWTDSDAVNAYRRKQRTIYMRKYRARHKKRP